MIAMTGKSNKDGLHLTRPVELNGEDYVLHYFSRGLEVRGEKVALPRELTAAMEFRLHHLVGNKTDPGTALRGSFLLERADLNHQTAIQFHGRWCHMGESFSSPSSMRYLRDAKE